MIVCAVPRSHHMHIPQQALHNLHPDVIANAVVCGTSKCSCKRRSCVLCVVFSCDALCVYAWIGVCGQCLSLYLCVCVYVCVCVCVCVCMCMCVCVCLQVLYGAVTFGSRDVILCGLVTCAGRWVCVVLYVRRRVSGRTARACHVSAAGCAHCVSSAAQKHDNG